jgi:hypothetical protein
MWILLIAYSKAKLKSNGNIASSCFKPFLIRNMSDKFLPSQTLLYISVRHIFISLTSFMGITNSMRILYKTSLLTESKAFLKSINSWRPASLYSLFFSSIWLMQNIRSVVDLLRENPYWWSPMVSSAYWVNLDSRMLDRVCTNLTKVICAYNYYNLFYCPSYR